jgi:hypothetical protein
VRRRLPQKVGAYSGELIQGPEDAYSGHARLEDAYSGEVRWALSWLIELISIHAVRRVTGC